VLETLLKGEQLCIQRLLKHVHTKAAPPVFRNSLRLHFMTNSFLFGLLYDAEILLNSPMLLRYFFLSQKVFFLLL
jgi:hypothetical protein